MVSSLFNSCSFDLFVCFFLRVCVCVYLEFRKVLFLLGRKPCNSIGMGFSSLLFLMFFFFVFVLLPFSSDLCMRKTNKQIMARIKKNVVISLFFLNKKKIRSQLNLRPVGYFVFWARQCYRIQTVWISF